MKKAFFKDGLFIFAVATILGVSSFIGFILFIFFTSTSIPKETIQFTVDFAIVLGIATFILVLIVSIVIFYYDYKKHSAR